LEFVTAGLVQVHHHAVVAAAGRTVTTSTAHRVAGRIGHINVVLEAHLNGYCRGHAGHARPGKGQLQMVEHQEHVARGHQCAGGQQLGQAREADQELVKDGGGAAVGQGAWHACEELARCGAVGEAPRVAARVDDEGTLAVPRFG